ncbi:MAG TPA: DUF1127 domain-containing protein [Hyphomicrobiaceae bacterium]|nr:DUF1127 domain-containing protein [Hyphomicrobiaceae bacterium]
MSTIDCRTDAAFCGERTPLYARILGWVRARYAAYAEERARCRTVQILRALDDRTLKDIGVERSDIGSFVYGRRGERGWSL